MPLGESETPPEGQLRESDHPFLDGNGRVGRLLVTLFLVEREVLPSPLLYLSAFFEATRTDYYGRLQAVHERGEWEDWLIYFLSGVARQSEDALNRAQRINSLLSRWRAKIAGSSQAALSLVDLVAENPYCTVRRVEKRLKVAFTTAQRAVERLRAAGVLEQINDTKRPHLLRNGPSHDPRGASAACPGRPRLMAAGRPQALREMLEP
jgi:Fic family protein